MILVKSLLNDSLVGIVPVSDTGAYEIEIWFDLGARGVEVCVSGNLFGMYLNIY